MGIGHSNNINGSGTRRAVFSLGRGYGDEHQHFLDWLIQVILGTAARCHSFFHAIMSAPHYSLDWPEI